MISPDRATESYQAEIDRAAEDPARFHNAFDRTESAEHHYVRGSWDVSVQILQPLLGHLRDPESKTALEIGFGAGRLLAGIAPFFGRVIGIDIHRQHDLVAERLRARGIQNFELRATDGNSIPAEAASIDLVYSFIVLQHLGRLAVLENYLREITRVLKPGGLAMIYVGRRSWFSYCRSSKLLYALDRLIELLPGVPPYRELDVPSPLEINLTVSAPRLKRLARAAGLEPLSLFPSRRKIPNDAHQFGSQYGILLRKCP